MSSNDEDDWDTDIILPTLPSKSTSIAKTITTAQPKQQEEEWHSEAPKAQPPTSTTKPNNNNVEKDDPIGKPAMLLVDLTVLSSGAIHNKHDAHSVNDPEKKKVLTNSITAEFARYFNDGKLLAAGTIKPCAQSVWPAALAELRRDFPGHFWAPIFPPKEN
jgi:hypothetical protein